MGSRVCGSGSRGRCTIHSLSYDLPIYDSVLVHQGDVNGGHYYAFIKSTVDGRWLKFDDDRVHPVAAKEVFEEHFGDTPPPAVAGATAPLRLNRYNVRRFTNAYMLVYIRDADVPTVLEDVTIADVPAHIPLKIAKESEEKERRDLERAERHLYMNVRVLREENVRGYQGFDMWNWDARKEELVTVRAKRQDKWVDVAVGWVRDAWICLCSRYDGLASSSRRRLLGNLDCNQARCGYGAFTNGKIIRSVSSKQFIRKIRTRVGVR